MATGILDIEDTPVWRIYNDPEDGPMPVLAAWYTDHKEEDFLTARAFGTQTEAEKWLKEFWQAYWRL